jgi:hypothetical protein
MSRPHFVAVGLSYHRARAVIQRHRAIEIRAYRAEPLDVTTLPKMRVVTGGVQGLRANTQRHR